MDGHNRQIRQVELGIDRLERRVIPVGDLAEINLSEGWTVDDNVAGLDAREIDDRDDAAHHHRKLREARFLQLLGLQRRVSRAESHGSRLDLLDARARSD